MRETRSEPGSHARRIPRPGRTGVRAPLPPGLPLVLGAAFLCGSCAPVSAGMEQAVICFIESVQDQDGERWLGCAAEELAGPVPDPGSSPDPAERGRIAGERLQGVARSFAEQRKAGVIDLSGSDGLLLTHFLSLGRGAYYVFGEPQLYQERARLRMEVRLFYRLIDYPRHRRRGETFWRLGRPLGTLYPIISGMTQLGTREELSRVEVDWVLERDAEGRWRVRGAHLLPETALYTTVGS